MKNNIKFPHKEAEEKLAKHVDYVLEDNAKLSCEFIDVPQILATTNDKERLDKACKAYYKFLTWVNICEQLEKNIANYDVVQSRLNLLWDNIDENPETRKSKCCECQANCTKNEKKVEKNE